MLPPCTRGAVSKLWKQWVSGNSNPSSRARAIWGETSKVSSRCEEKERVYSERDDSERNKPAVLLDVTVYCTQNAAFLEFGFGVTAKFTDRKGCGLSAKADNGSNSGLRILTPSLAQCRLQRVEMCSCAYTLKYLCQETHRLA